MSDNDIPRICCVCHRVEQPGETFAAAYDLPGLRTPNLLACAYHVVRSDPDAVRLGGLPADTGGMPGALQDSAGMARQKSSHSS